MGNLAIDEIHDLVHALRKVEGYAPTQFEREINEIIADVYSKDCQECKYKKEQIKINKYKLSQKKEGIFGGLFK